MADDDVSGMRAELRDPEELPADPDLAEDLGYDLMDLDVISPDNDRERVLIMPKDEEMLRDEMFVIVDTDTFVDLIDEV